MYNDRKEMIDRVLLDGKLGISRQTGADSLELPLYVPTVGHIGIGLIYSFPIIHFRRKFETNVEGRFRCGQIGSEGDGRKLT